MSRADRLIRWAAGLAVAGLAVIAGAVSYAHMLRLADGHGETGWRGHAFPLSVDGVEVVASLVLLADRRLGRRSGWLVWVSLAAGTGASMAANVAVGASDPVGRVVAGWPAVSLLLAIKLLSGLIDHHTESTQPAARTAAVRPPAGGRSVASDAERTRRRVREAGTVRGTDATSLLAAAVSVRDAVTADGTKLTRGVLADRLRRQGMPVSNARLTWLLKQLDAGSSAASVTTGSHT